MPNVKSAIKRVKVSRAKALRNKTQKSALKTILKKARETIGNKDEAAADILKNAIKALDKASAKNVIHKNTAARKKSKLMKAFNSVNK